MMNGGPFCIIIRGGLFMDRCRPVTRQMVKIRRLGIELTMMKAIQFHITLVGDKEIDKFDGKVNRRRW